MNRPRAIAVVIAAAGVLGLIAAWRPAPDVPSLACPDGGELRLGADGVATCGEGAPLPAGQALTLGQRFDCNTATEADFALVPGVGPALAAQIVAARDGGFTSWEQIDAVEGVGPSRLNALQAACDIRVADAGLW